MSVAAERFYSEEEYLEMEREAPTKSEYIAGQIFAMAGGSSNHSIVSVNVVSIAKGQLRGKGCRPYNSDMRVRVSKTSFDTYPDMSIICGAPEFLDAKQDTLLNPVAIVEVLSPSTEAHDRGDKFAHYQRLDSLQEYLLVAQDQPRIDRYVRQPDNTWLLTVCEGLKSELPLASVPCRLALAEVYEDVAFPERKLRLRSSKPRRS